MSSNDFDRLTQNSEGYFRQRVVEVHKRYAFISPEPSPENSHKRCLATTVARKFLQAKRTERNFVAVGDLVYAKLGEGLSRS